jgi:deazaflavin-dependent oxidoreductase (nitroreductase family)
VTRESGRVLHKHPLWYFNLISEPHAELQIGAEQWSVRARLAGEEEKTRLWPTLLETYPGYATYVSWTERVVPVVVLEAR